MGWVLPYLLAPLLLATFAFVYVINLLFPDRSERWEAFWSSALWWAPLLVGAIWLLVSLARITWDASGS
jgi:hypothetical protein